MFFFLVIENCFMYMFDFEKKVFKFLYIFVSLYKFCLFICMIYKLCVYCSDCFLF